MKKLFTALGNASFITKQPFLFILMRMIRFGNLDSPYSAIYAEYRGQVHPDVAKWEEQALSLFELNKNVKSDRKFVYVGPKAYDQLDELYHLHDSSQFIFPKLVEFPPQGALFFLNDEETSPGVIQLDNIFSNVIIGANCINPIPWYVTGWPLGLLRMLYNIWRLYGHAHVHVVGVDFYTAKIKHAPAYLKNSSIRKPIIFKQAMLRHDVILNFWVVRNLWRNKLISGDKTFENVMQMNIKTFAKVIFSNI